MYYLHTRSLLSLSLQVFLDAAPSSILSYIITWLSLNSAYKTCLISFVFSSYNKNKKVFTKPTIKKRVFMYAPSFYFPTRWWKMLFFVEYNGFSIIAFCLEGEKDRREKSDYFLLGAPSKTDKKRSRSKISFIDT